MIISAFTPIFLIVFFGFLVSRMPVFNAAAWSELERLVCYIFLPALLILRLASANFDWDDLIDISKVVVLALFAITVFVFSLRKFLGGDLASLSSVYQGSIRFNFYIGLACIEVLYGGRGLTTAALSLVILAPLVNVLCVVASGGSREHGSKRVSRIINSVLTDPLVLACVVGISVSCIGFDIPKLAESILEMLSQSALPLGLLVVGASIRFVSLGEQNWQILVAVLNKIGLFLGLILGACLFFDTPNAIAGILILLAALPVPTSAYMLTRQLGGNESLIVNISTVQTVAAFFVIPVWLDLAGRYL